MDPKQFFEQLQTQINQILETSPAKDIEKNIRALLTQGLAKLDVVTREEFDAQSLQLARIRERLEVLEKRVAELETILTSGQTYQRS
ncbi:MAG: accessory factor UbiK family protein [Oxalobacter sp.]|jgi:BMFP domain-containing protein YqiC|nr:MAG: accessory factor UbiK family protein [Oxalobacter sp.]